MNGQSVLAELCQIAEAGLTVPIYLVTSRLCPYFRSSEPPLDSSSKIWSSLSQLLYHCRKDGRLMNKGLCSHILLKNVLDEIGVRMSASTCSAFK